MKTIIVDYEIGSNSFLTKLRVTDDVFTIIQWGEYHFADAFEIKHLKDYLRQLTWLDGTNRPSAPITITKISEVK